MQRTIFFFLLYYRSRCVDTSSLNNFPVESSRTKAARTDLFNPTEINSLPLLLTGVVKGGTP